MVTVLRLKRGYNQAISVSSGLHAHTVLCRALLSAARRTGSGVRVMGSRNVSAALQQPRHQLAVSLVYKNGD